MTQDSQTSPRWGSTTKLLVSLILVGIVAFLLNRFSDLIPPLLLIFVIAYLLHPVTAFISRLLRIPWKVSVNILYLVILLALLGLLTWGGVGLVGQVQSLIKSIQDIVANLPRYVEDLSTRVFVFGPWQFDMSSLELDFNTISQQLLSFIQPLLGRTGNLVGAIASGAASIFGWIFFVLIVSYFVMTESSGLQRDLLKIEIPGYEKDLNRLGNELSRIWNAFLRGQIIIFALATGIYSILLPILGVRYALGIALMAGLAKFLPYIGPAITWVVMALVTFIYPPSLFADRPLLYMAIVVVITLVIDQIIDSFITPRIMAQTLKVHPAAVLIAALIAANLLGLLGVVIAAPFLATFTLLGRYVMRKLFDMNPWPEAEPGPPPPVASEFLTRIKHFFRPKVEKIAQEEPVTLKEKPNEQQPQRAKNRNNRRNR
ncbi:MAG: AI-2E family transporter [Chloroflexi bacterium]|nr:AI-2E family transporter [Chloroflexota bacterium]